MNNFFKNVKEHFSLAWNNATGFFNFLYLLTYKHTYLKQKFCNHKYRVQFVKGGMLKYTCDICGYTYCRKNYKKNYNSVKDVPHTKKV